MHFLPLLCEIINTKQFGRTLLLTPFIEVLFLRDLNKSCFIYVIIRAHKTVFKKYIHINIETVLFFWFIACSSTDVINLM